MTRAYRIAYLVSHPIQYQAPLLRYLTKHREIDLTVFFLSDHSIREYHDEGFGARLHRDVPLLDGYKNVFLPAVGKRDQISFWRPSVHGLWWHFRKGSYDVLWVHGYAHQVNLCAIAIARRLGMKILLRGESHLKASRGSLARVWFKDKVLPRLFHFVDGFLALGSWNRDFLRPLRRAGEKNIYDALRDAHNVSLLVPTLSLDEAVQIHGLAPPISSKWMWKEPSRWFSQVRENT